MIQTNNSRCFTIISFIRALTCLLFSVPVFAQTADTATADTAVRTANATGALPPGKQQVKDVALLLAEQKKYITLDFDHNNDVKYKIENAAPEYKLPGAKSRTVLVELPDYVGEYTLKIRSMLHSGGVFSPTVVFLDSQYRPVRLLPNNNFIFGNPKVLQTVSLRAELRMSNSAEKYMLIYTTKSGELLSMVSSATNLNRLVASPDGKLELEVRRN